MTFYFSTFFFIPFHYNLFFLIYNFSYLCTTGFQLKCELYFITDHYRQWRAINNLQVDLKLYISFHSYLGILCYRIKYYELAQGTSKKNKLLVYCTKSISTGIHSKEARWKSRFARCHQLTITTRILYNFFDNLNCEAPVGCK